MKGIELRIRRLALNLSIGEMAKAIGVSKATYDNWERGRSHPSDAARASLLRGLARLESDTSHLELSLPEEAMQALTRRAAGKGLSPAEYAAQILEGILS